MNNSITESRLLIQTALEAEPRKHDPGVIEVRYRPSGENATREHPKGGFSFAPIKRNGDATLYPPIIWMSDIVMAKFRSLGHGVHTPSYPPTLAVTEHHSFE